MGNMCIVIIWFPVYDAITLKLTLAFLLSRFILDQKCQDKKINLLKTKRTLNRTYHVIQNICHF